MRRLAAHMPEAFVVNTVPMLENAVFMLSPSVVTAVTTRHP
jgi:hypothetical protein